MRPEPTESLPQIAKPCAMDWDTMDGDSKQRHCESCQLSVTNLSALPPQERRAFIRDARAEPARRVCIAYEFRADGRPVLRTRWDFLAVPLRALRRFAAASAALCLPFAFSNCTTRKAMMGEYTIPEPGATEGCDPDSRRILPGTMQETWEDAEKHEPKARGVGRPLATPPPGEE